MRKRQKTRRLLLAGRAAHSGRRHMQCWGPELTALSSPTGQEVRTDDKGQPEERTATDCLGPGTVFTGRRLSQAHRAQTRGTNVSPKRVLTTTATTPAAGPVVARPPDDDPSEWSGARIGPTRTASSSEPPSAWASCASCVPCVRASAARLRPFERREKPAPTDWRLEAAGRLEPASRPPAAHWHHLLSPPSDYYYYYYHRRSAPTAGPLPARLGAPYYLASRSTDALGGVSGPRAATMSGQMASTRAGSRHNKGRPRIQMDLEEEAGERLEESRIADSKEKAAPNRCQPNHCNRFRLARFALYLLLSLSLSLSFSLLPPRFLCRPTNRRVHFLPTHRLSQLSICKTLCIPQMESALSDTTSSIDLTLPLNWPLFAPSLASFCSGNHISAHTSLLFPFSRCSPSDIFIYLCKERTTGLILPTIL